MIESVTVNPAHAPATGRELRLGALSLRWGGQKMPDPNLPGPSPDWVRFMGIPYEPLDRAVGDKRTWMGAAKVSAWVERAVSIIVDNMATVPLVVYRGNADDKEPVPDHPINAILRRPNPYTIKSYAKLVSAIMRPTLLRGENYLRCVRNRARLPAELYWLSPDMMIPIPDPTTFVAGFKLNTGRGQVDLGIDDVYWYQVFNPLDPYGGLTPIDALRSTINLDVSAIGVQRAVYANGGLARGIISPDNKDGVPMGRSAVTELEQDWKEKMAGSGRAHSIAIIGTPVKFQDIALKEDEAQWIATRGATRVEILSLYGIPKEIGSSEATSYDNARAARFTLWNETLIPRLIWLRDEIQGSLVYDYDPDGSQGLFVEHDLSKVRALLPDWDELERAYQVSIRTGDRTINQVRAARGEPPVSWGDGWWAPITMADMSKSDGTPFPRVTQAISAVASEAVVPIQPSGAESNAGPAPAPAHGAEPAGGIDWAKRRKAVAVLRTPAERAAIGERHARALDTAAGVMAHEVASAFARQRDAIIATMPSKRRKLTSVDAVLVSAQADLFAAASRAFHSAGTEAYESVDTIIDGAVAAARKHRKQSGITLEFDISNPALVDLARQLGTRIVAIDQQTLDDVRDMVGEGLRRGYSVTQIADGVPDEDYHGIMGLFEETYAGRSIAIARTETAWAFSRTSMQAYRDSGVVDQKEWLLGIGDAEGHCDALDGEVVDVDDTFSDGSDAPPDPHPNCTCSLLPVVNVDAIAGDEEPEPDEEPADVGTAAMERIASKAAAEAAAAVLARMPVPVDHTADVLAVLGRVLEVVMAAPSRESKALLDDIRAKVDGLKEATHVTNVNVAPAAPGVVEHHDHTTINPAAVSVPLTVESAKVTVEHHDRGPAHIDRQVEYDRNGNPIRSSEDRTYDD